MSEEAYPKDHPAHPDNAGKPYVNPGTPITHDYPVNHPARGGQGQAVPTEAVTGLPREGFRHLHGLPGDTLAKRQEAFRALSSTEQEARLEWNTKGIPAPPENKG